MHGIDAILPFSERMKDNTEGVITIAPWLTVPAKAGAIDFYKSAFHAIEVYHIEDPDGNVVARLSINGAEFWLSEDPDEKINPDNIAEFTSKVRMILTVPDPDTFFENAIKAGARLVSPVKEEYGWRVGRLSDPFGYHWEIGKETEKN